MGREARAVCRKIDFAPFYVWEEEFVWEDDEFEGLKRKEWRERITKQEEGDEMCEAEVSK